MTTTPPNLTHQNPPQLSTDSKEPAEPLEAYATTALKLTGNSTHLAPWHAKLGFHSTPWTSTLRSLSRDGGVAAVMRLVVQKVYPVAYLEFVEVGGKVVREGPRDERDEGVAQDQWRVSVPACFCYEAGGWVLMVISFCVLCRVDGRTLRASCGTTLSDRLSR